MFIILETLFTIGLIILIASQVVMPMVTRFDYFWLFKKNIYKKSVSVSGKIVEMEEHLIDAKALADTTEAEVLKKKAEAEHEKEIVEKVKAMLNEEKNGQ